MTDTAETPRIAPLEPPYEPAIGAMLEKWMPPGSAIEPLALFRTLAVHDELFARMRPLGARDSRPWADRAARARIR